MLEFWTDHHGKQWPFIRSPRRLKFKYPSHAALRAFVFNRDGYCCRRCGARGVNVPAGYSGRWALRTDTKTGVGSQDVLVVDHVITLRAGGLSVPENLQTLCETCNKRKQKEDKAETKRVAGETYGC